MSGVLEVITQILIAVLFYWVGWTRCHRKFCQTYKSALNESKLNEAGSYNQGWLDCLEYFMDLIG
ncbi:hypothetical protein [Enterococcus sp. AZ109]|uniref:hypothetical protein n=1 Tax=Enterococcus sp. AZ109 TaxID=2774634 RepID=UPI003F28285C